MYYPNISKSALLLAAAFCYSLISNTAFAAEPMVDCTKSNASVQKAIDDAKHGEKTTIFITGGICNESVTIITDDITLHGDKDGDGLINGGVNEVHIIGARRVTIQSLEITGDGYGVFAEDGAVVNIFDNNIHHNINDGVAVGNHSFARVYYSTITTNGRPDPHFEAGIQVWAGSQVRSVGNVISDNGYAAVEVGSQSYFRSGFFTNGNPDPDDLDVILQKGCTQGDAAGTCGDAGTVALDFYRSGTADLRNTDITGYSTIWGMSDMDVRTTIINGDIDAAAGSRVHLRGSVTGSFTLNCFTNGFAPGHFPCGTIFPGPGPGPGPGPIGPAGGIVFYTTDGGLTGLEAAPVDQSGGTSWGCRDTDIDGADGTAIGTGAQNTADILAGCSDPGIAARLADDYELNGFSDWYLPSKDELNELYLQKDDVGNFTSNGYWSSSEQFSVGAWFQDFNDGSVHILDRNGPTGVRAIRAFAF